VSSESHRTNKKSAHAASSALISKTAQVDYLRVVFPLILSHSGIDVTPEPGLFLSRDYDGDDWEITVMRTDPMLGRLCKRCTHHELRPVYHDAEQECSRSLTWADTVRHGGRIPDPSGPQQATKKEMEKLEPTVRTCRKFKNSGCGETKYFSGRVCPSCVEKKAQLKQDKSRKKQERAIAQAAKQASKKARQTGPCQGSSSSSSGTTTTGDSACRSGASDKAHFSRDQTAVVAPALMMGASTRRPQRAAVMNALVRAEIERALQEPSPDRERSGPSPDRDRSESESESSERSSSGSESSARSRSQSSSSDSEQPLSKYR